jgi:hypothetical protein
MDPTKSADVKKVVGAKLAGRRYANLAFARLQ